MSHKTEVDVKLPNIKDLYCINCKVTPLNVRDSIVKSLFHCQILTCRLIIYTAPSCIACPSIQNIGDLIHVIVSRKFWDSGKLQKHLQDLKIQFSDPEHVHPRIYEASLRYTFTFKLAPQWNLIHKFHYVQNINFLPLPHNVNAMVWNLISRANGIKLELMPTKMILFPFTLDSLPIPPTMLDNFKSNNAMLSIDLRLFQTPYVYVLPKMTRAKVISASRILPNSSPFENYDVLRRHWKNMYSYRLPKSDKGMIYYEVVFQANPNQVFTYPEACVVAKLPQQLMCDNKDKISKEFLKDLATSIHSVCGKVIQIDHSHQPSSTQYSCMLRQNQKTLSSRINSEQSPFFRTPSEYLESKMNQHLMSNSSPFTYGKLTKSIGELKKNNKGALSLNSNSRNRRRKNKYLPNSLSLLPDEMVCDTDENLTYNSDSSLVFENQDGSVYNDEDSMLSFRRVPLRYSKDLENEYFGVGKNADSRKKNLKKKVDNIDDNYSFIEDYKNAVKGFLPPCVNSTMESSKELVNHFKTQADNEHLDFNKFLHECSHSYPNNSLRETSSSQQYKPDKSNDTFTLHNTQEEDYPGDRKFYITTQKGRTIVVDNKKVLGNEKHNNVCHASKPMTNLKTDYESRKLENSEPSNVENSFSMHLNDSNNNLKESSYRTPKKDVRHQKETFVPQENDVAICENEEVVTMPKISSEKPVITNIENVSYDLENIVKSTTIYKYRKTNNSSDEPIKSSDELKLEVDLVEMPNIEDDKTGEQNVSLHHGDCENSSSYIKLNNSQSFHENINELNGNSTTQLFNQSIPFDDPINEYCTDLNNLYQAEKNKDFEKKLKELRQQFSSSFDSEDFNISPATSPKIFKKRKMNDSYVKDENIVNRTPYRFEDISSKSNFSGRISPISYTSTYKNLEMGQLTDRTCSSSSNFKNIYKPNNSQNCQYKYKIPQECPLPLNIKQDGFSDYKTNCEDIFSAISQSTDDKSKMSQEKSCANDSKFSNEKRDFLFEDLLDESSEESDTEKYRSYKQVCKEALTFDQ